MSVQLRSGVSVGASILGISLLWVGLLGCAPSTSRPSNAIQIGDDRVPPLGSHAGISFWSPLVDSASHTVLTVTFSTGKRTISLRNRDFSQSFHSPYYETPTSGVLRLPVIAERTAGDTIVVAEHELQLKNDQWYATSLTFDRHPGSMSLGMIPIALYYPLRGGMGSQVLKSC